METRGSISACNGFGKRIIIKKNKITFTMLEQTGW